MCPLGFYPFFSVTINISVLLVTLSDYFLGYCMDITNYIVKQINKFVSIKLIHCIDFKLPFTLECIISSMANLIH